MTSKSRPSLLGVAGVAQGYWTGRVVRARIALGA